MALWARGAAGGTRKPGARFAPNAYKRGFVDVSGRRELKKGPGDDSPGPSDKCDDRWGPIDLIEIEVQPDPEFERDGHNIRSDVKVPLVTVLLGGKIDVKTIHGTVTMTVPAGTSSDSVMRIGGQGIQSAKAKGDHLVRVVVQVPQKEFTDDQQDQLREALGE